MHVFFYGFKLYSEQDFILLFSEMEIINNIQSDFSKIYNVLRK